MIIKLSHGALAAAVLAAGCTTTGPAELAAIDCDRYDCSKMNAISKQARVKGVQVVWVNPPQKQAPKD